MEILAEIDAINEALKILRDARSQLVDGAEAVWRINFDATKHLETRVEELMKDLCDGGA
jgi:heme oxygenase